MLSTTDLRFGQLSTRYSHEELRVDCRLSEYRPEVSDWNAWKDVFRTGDLLQQRQSVGRSFQHTANLRTVLANLQTCYAVIAVSFGFTVTEVLCFETRASYDKLTPL